MPSAGAMYRCQIQMSCKVSITSAMSRYRVQVPSTGVRRPWLTTTAERTNPTYGSVPGRTPGYTPVLPRPARNPSPASLPLPASNPPPCLSSPTSLPPSLLSLPHSPSLSPTGPSCQPAPSDRGQGRRPTPPTARGVLLLQRLRQDTLAGRPRGPPGESPVRIPSQVEYGTVVGDMVQ